jgi:hypothetical protein
LDEVNHTLTAYGTVAIAEAAMVGVEEAQFGERVVAETKTNVFAVGLAL